MPIEASTFDDLSAAEVAAEVAKFQQFVREANDAVGVSGGAFYDLILALPGVPAALTRHDLARYVSARSLLDIAANPTLADGGVVDGVLSNFGVVRLAGGKATGRVLVVVDALRTVVVAAGAALQAGGRDYVVQSTVAAQTEAEAVNAAGDVLLFATGDGRYAFAVPVEAAADGPEYAAKRDAAFTFTSPPSGFVRAYAAEDFAQGRDAETNAEALARMRRGVAMQAPANRVCAEAMLAADDRFVAVDALSIVGMRDAEMLRDKHWIFPLGAGGRVDWYLRAQPTLQRSSATVEATCLSVAGARESTWTATLDRDQAAGVYEVEKILPTGVLAVEGTLAVVADTRQLDLTDSPHDVENVLEGAYSRFQTITVVFTDVVTDTTGVAAGDKADYDFVMTRQPLVAELQDYLDDDARTPPDFDLLVRSCVPCFVTAWVTLKKRPTATVDDAAVKAAIMQAVHQSRFNGAVYAADLAAAVSDVVGSTVKVAEIFLQGRIRTPVGAELLLTSSLALDAPDRPADGVSKKTLGFFIDEDGIGLSVQNSSHV